MSTDRPETDMDATKARKTREDECGEEANRFIRFGLHGPCQTVRDFVAFYLGVRARRKGLPDSGLAWSDSRRDGRCMAVAQFTVR